MIADANNSDFSKLIEPFSFSGRDTGCLLLHGFTGSPSELRLMGEFLSGNGIGVSCPLLPGHGTTIDDLDSCTWRNWCDMAEKELLLLKKSYSKVFICGLSMGGSIGLYLATKHQVDGIATLAAGVKLKDIRVILLPFLRHFNVRIQKTRNAFARGNDRIRFAYDYNSSRATWQLIQFYRYLKRNLDKVTSPLLLINSRYDRTIPFENTEIISSHVRSEYKKIIPLERTDHIITLCDEKDFVEKAVLDFFQAHI